MGLPVLVSTFQSITEASWEKPVFASLLLAPWVGSCCSTQSLRLSSVILVPLNVLPISSLESTAAWGTLGVDCSTVGGSGATSGWRVSWTRQKLHIPEK